MIMTVEPVVIIVVQVVIVMIMVLVVVVEARPHRPNPDPPVTDAKRGGQFAGNGGGRSTGTRGADDRAPRSARTACDACWQPRRRCRAAWGAVSVSNCATLAVRAMTLSRCAWRTALDAFPSEERDGDTLCHGEGQEEEQR